MAASRLTIHVFDAETRKARPDLHACVQFLRLTNLPFWRMGPTADRVLVEPLKSVSNPGSLELMVDLPEPCIGEVRLFDPPRDAWPIQEWKLVRPGGESEFWIAVYPVDIKAWPGDGGERLLRAMLENVAPLGTYAALEGRFHPPEGLPPFDLLDLRSHLERSAPEPKFVRLSTPMLFPPEGWESKSWLAIPLPPGAWTLCVEGSRIKSWHRQIELMPGQKVDLGDVTLEARVPG